MSIQENIGYQSRGCGGRLLKALTAIEVFAGEGDESAFLRGEARGLTTQAQMILPYRSAEDLLDNPKR